MVPICLSSLRQDVNLLDIHCVAETIPDREQCAVSTAGVVALPVHDRPPRDADGAAGLRDGRQSEGEAVRRSRQGRWAEGDVQEHQLHVGPGEARVAAPHHRGLGVVGVAGRNRLCDLVDDVAQRVVVEVAADAGQAMRRKYGRTES